MYEDGRAKTYLSPVLSAAMGLVILAAGFGGGFFFEKHRVTGSSAATSAAGEPAGIDFSPVWTVWNVINDQYVPVAVGSSTPIVATSTPDANQQKVWGMAEGLASSLNDPYTYFLPPTENKQFSDSMSGSFGGVGMEIDERDQVLTVISALKGTPADKAGIKSGDQVLDIDGTSTQAMDVTTAVQEIRGPQGTVVTLTLLRSGWNAPREFKVTRDVINVPEVTTNARPDGIFVIAIATFTSSSPDLFRSALRQFVQSGDTKLVLDLRGNPGGYLDAAVDIASWFLPSGNIIVTEDYAGHAQNIVHRSLGYNIFNSNLKMVVLVDHGSASASEILADALHYWGVAQLVGVNTYGKGSVQELVSITPDTSLKVTVARWLGPDGIHIPLTGIAPDFQVPLTDADIASSTDTQMNKAVGLLGGNLAATGTPEVVQ